MTNSKTKPSIWKILLLVCGSIAAIVAFLVNLNTLIAGCVATQNSHWLTGWICQIINPHSPVSGLIVYSMRLGSSDDLYTLEPTANDIATPLNVQGSQPRWGRDGSGDVLYSMNNNGRRQLMRYNLSSGTSSTFLSNSNGDIFEIAPHMTLTQMGIVITQCPNGFKNLFEFQNTQLNPNPLLDCASVRESPDQSPTAPILVFTTQTGSNATVQTYDQQEGTTSIRNVSSVTLDAREPRWDATGQRIVFSMMVPRTTGQSDYGLYVWDKQTGNYALMFDRPGTDEVSPSWSSSGEEIAFISRNSQTRIGTIEIFTISSGQSRTVANTPAQYTDLDWLWP